ncbi:MAG: YqiA/YcfP family alpha/beta fold hydrolase [Terriglobia bacterium]
MRYLYLHGFASGPASRKAQAFAVAMRHAGVELEIPALDRDDFEHLTITSQLDLVTNLLAGEPARLIGSSMGGYLAALYAAAHPEIDRLVLLAPAFQFGPRWREILGPEKVRDWQITGSLPIFHYGVKEIRTLSCDLLYDVANYAPEPDFRQPALIFHGRQDETVPIAFSRTFAASHPAATLTELDSDHELTGVIDQITEASISFFEEREPELH